MDYILYMTTGYSFQESILLSSMCSDDEIRVQVLIIKPWYFFHMGKSMFNII